MSIITIEELMNYIDLESLYGYGITINNKDLREDLEKYMRINDASR